MRFGVALLMVCAFFSLNCSFGMMCHNCTNFTRKRRSTLLWTCGVLFLKESKKDLPNIMKKASTQRWWCMLKLRTPHFWTAAGFSCCCKYIDKVTVFCTMRASADYFGSSHEPSELSLIFKWRRCDWSQGRATNGFPVIHKECLQTTFCFLLLRC